MPLRILYEDEYLVAVDKPAGFTVHQPEDAKKISHRFCCLQVLRDQTGKYVYPIHRLDRATSGVLLFGKDPSTARKLHESWHAARVSKNYACLVRGFLNETHIDRPLKGEKGGTQAAETLFQPLFHKEIDHSVEKYATSRYTLALAAPVTGRFHQIRRHLAHVSHPIIGDKAHGDGAHNRFFRENLNMPWLYLRAVRLSFPHPVTEKQISIEARWNGKWHRLFDWLGFCPTKKQLQFSQAPALPCGSSLEKTRPSSPE